LHKDNGLLLMTLIVGHTTYVGGHMLEALFGSINRERVLLYIYAREECYAREISRFFQTDLDPIQKQLERLEIGNILYSRSAGKTILYKLNPRFPFLKELKELLGKILDFYPRELKDPLLYSRKRPRRKNKPQ